MAACCPDRAGQRGWPYSAHWFIFHNSDGEIDTSVTYQPGALPRSDVELALSVAGMMREAGCPLLFGAQTQRWLMWDGSGRYAPQKATFAGAMTRRIALWHAEAVSDVLEAVREEIGRMPANIQDRVTKAADKAWGSHRLYRKRLWDDAGQRAMEHQLAAVFTVDENDMDRRTGRIVLDNGVIELAQVLRDGYVRLLPHNPDVLVTRRTGLGLAWEPDARCDAFERFLETSVADADQRWWLCWRTCAALFGIRPRQGFLNLIGETNSGKTTFINLIAALAGDYGQPVPVDTFLAKRTGDQFSKHLLKGARFVHTQEPDEHQLYDVGFMKLITGDDSLTTRTLYEGYVTWVPQCTPFIGSNSPIRFNTADAAMMGRLESIRFRRGYETADPHLSSRLRAELPGILAYLIRHVTRTVPQLPQSVINERELMAVQTEDALEFIQEYLENGLLREVGSDYPAYHCVVRSRLYDAYRYIWCEANGTRPVNMRTFVGIVDRKYPKAHSGQRVFTGLAQTDRWA
jgi:P4 family phage/plasmid primase-like protien